MHFTQSELHDMGLRQIGRDCAVHRSAQFFNPQHIALGDNVRIDCFCVLSAGPQGLRIGNHIHIGVGSCLFGSSGELVLEDFAGLSSRATLFTASDDFSEGFLHAPNIPEAFRKVTCGDIRLRCNSIVGCGSVVLPGITVGVNAAVGALTLVHRDVPDHVCVAGIPARRVGTRDPLRYEQLIRDFQEQYEA
jgi:dTDP-4-amino-4,6-dideoxy-D-glucose acyltransferase